MTTRRNPDNHQRGTSLASPTIMSQRIAYLRGSDASGATLVLPMPDTRVWGCLEWGRAEVPFSPSFWVVQAKYWAEAHGHSSCFRLGRSLREEAAACLLGGHGIPAEIGLAAFARLRDDGLLDGQPVNEPAIREALQMPLALGNRSVRYRFARQKSRYLASMLTALDSMPANLSDRGMRDWLIDCPGVGPKTASWIVRNWRASNDVAIIDIHLQRAGILSGFFSLQDKLPRDYARMEERFLDFAKAIDVPASILDAVIWQQMRRSGTLAHRMLEEASDASQLHAAA